MDDGGRITWKLWICNVEFSILWKLGNNGHFKYKNCRLNLRFIQHSADYKISLKTAEYQQ